MRIKTTDNNCSGFTLVEIMVVLSIIVLLAILVVSGYSEGRPRLATERAVEGFINDLYRVRNRGFLEMPYSVDGTQESAKIGSYGLDIKKGEQEYTVFFRDDDDNDYEIEVVTIEDLVEVEDIKVRGTAVSSAEILFKEKEVYFNEVLAGEGDTVEVEFFPREEVNIKRVVVVNNKGVARISYE